MVRKKPPFNFAVWLLYCDDEEKEVDAAIIMGKAGKKTVLCIAMSTREMQE